VGNLLAIIPARGGSRRLPNKNILPMPNGKGTVLSHAIEVAILSGCSNVFVSTDSAEIAQQAEKAGATAIARVPAMAVDSIGTQEVAADALRTINANRDDLVCVIYPCTPLLDPMRCCRGRERLEHNQGKFIVAVGKFQSPIHRALEWTDRNTLRSAMPQFDGWTGDRLPPRYFDAGQFYWGQASSFMDALPLYENAIPLVLPPWEAIDINWHVDWDLATRLLKGAS
jgi:pseudaminic acid cytidylyltransferase